MKNSTIIASALALAAVIGTAEAQTPFDGGYFGLGLGYGFGDVKDFDATGNLNVEGALASTVIGWNFSNGNMVYGAEADLSVGSVSGSATCVNPTWSCEADVKALGSLRGRLGIAQNNWMAYVTAGGAAGRVRLQTIDGVGTVFPGTEWATGWVAGLGFEGVMPNSPWHYRVEYLHHELSERTYQTDVTYNSAVSVGVARAMMTMRF